MNPKTKAAAAAVDEMTKPVEANFAAGKDMVESFVKVGQEAAQKGYEQAVTMTKDQVEKARTAVAKGVDEMSTLGKDNVDAVVQAGTIYARGVEVIGKEVMSYAQARMESNMAAMKAMLGARTLKELVDLQTEFARSTFDQMVTETTKLSEIGVKVTNEAFAPINARVNQVVEKITKSAAAA
ncbi:phasin family protein [Stella humosa]|uniref:Phasin family protein n=1 Tax=Stella humosa TaxID=94 RepID=A0A3N1MBY9_9PROT|nr:phasin family protein [Stella humosa]ROQ00270.1 phasin family protein [Stella humosa]BBK30492.1 hypothetical protein STHU_11260 [Stella humosa]